MNSKRNLINWYIFFILAPVFGKSRLGNTIVQIGEYRFYRNRLTVSGKTHWSCNKKNSGCKAVLHSVNGIIIDAKTLHNH